MMFLKQSKGHEVEFNLFGVLNRYEKGVVARAFLGSLIAQGYLASPPENGSPGEFVISVSQWQLNLFPHFKEEADLDENKYELPLESLDQIC